ncbi:MAG: hypothetical protein KDI19_04700, partial [Pseudomonadales bacterium]|nr:hypothetical protein [Pseudomonadales bacterium]
EEGAALHRREASQLVTSRGTRLTADIGAYTLAAFGAASEGDKASSFNFAEGTAHDVTRAPAWAQFGIGDMLRETEEQIDTKSFGGNFVGDVILAPMAVHDLFGWLLEQIGDYALIANASVYKTHVGEAIASPMLDIRSRFDGPGEEPFTGDGFNAPPVHLLDNGKLTCLLPSYYGSRKTGILHTPAASGWVIRPGETPFADLVSGIEKGAIVNRLSMGEPAPNGDFSGVIKNSFKIEGGKRGDALSETMIAGNMARMLTDISGISREYLDTGSTAFPWIRIPGLHFS